MRTVMVFTGVALGGVEFVGACLWAIGGAGIYGSPLGGGPWANRVIVFLLTGPMSLLPASVLAIWRPRWAGVWLTVTAVASAIAAVRVMDPLLPGAGEWSPGRDSVGYYTFKWSLTLIIPFSLPMLVLGLGFLCSASLKNASPVKGATADETEFSAKKATR
jgi:hypothetical protein